MRSQIAVGSGLKIKRSAEIKDNTEVKHTLHQVKLAIQEGKLDHVWSLQTLELTGEVNENGVKKYFQRNMNMSELDEHIKKNRDRSLQNIDFALDQMALFSKYLKKNVHASYNGYSASMILNFIPESELTKLIDVILDQHDKAKSGEFIEGKYNNIYGEKQTIREHIQGRIANQYHLKLEDQK